MFAYLQMSKVLQGSAPRCPHGTLPVWKWKAVLTPYAWEVEIKTRNYESLAKAVADVEDKVGPRIFNPDIYTINGETYASLFCRRRFIEDYFE